MTGFHTECADGIAVLTIDRPKANAIDAATSTAMGEQFVRWDADPEVRVVIVTGAGERFFSAGWDLSAGEDFDSDYGPGGFGGFPDLPDRHTPVIAAVNGMAVGGGFEIAMAADLVVAAEHAMFWLPEASLGVLADAGSVRLPRLLPPHVARHVLIAGKRMTAAELHRWGLVNDVVPVENLLAAARQMAHDVIACAPLSVAAVLDIERRTGTLPVDQAMAALPDLPSYRAAIDSADAAEGSVAFAERRPPRWLGR
jgi:crotonobetainyl-CoA hydratase